MKSRMIGLLVAVAVLVGIAMPSFAVSTNDQTIGSAAALPGSAKPVMIIEGYANFSQTAALFSGINVGTNSGASDVYKVINIPSNCYVQRVATKMITLESAQGTQTYSVGDSTAVGSYNTGVALTNYTVNVSATTSNKVYTSADWISIVPSATCTNGRVKVMAEIMQF